MDPGPPPDTSAAGGDGALPAPQVLRSWSLERQLAFKRQRELFWVGQSTAACLSRCRALGLTTGGNQLAIADRIAKCELDPGLLVGTDRRKAARAPAAARGLAAVPKRSKRVEGIPGTQRSRKDANMYYDGRPAHGIAAGLADAGSARPAWADVEAADDVAYRKEVEKIAAKRRARKLTKDQARTALGAARARRDVAASGCRDLRDAICSHKWETAVHILTPPQAAVARQAASRLEPRERWLPLHFAAQHKAPVQVMQLLLAAHVGGCGHADVDGWLPIHVSAAHDKGSVGPTAGGGWAGQNAAVQLPGRLLRACAASQHHVADIIVDRKETAQTALADTGTDGPTEPGIGTAEAILHAWPEAASVADSSGCLPLHVAVVNHASAVLVKKLLEAYPAGARRWNNYGRLPLHLSVFRTLDARGKVIGPPASAEVVQLLVNAFPGGAGELDGDGNAPHQIGERSKASADILGLLSKCVPSLPSTFVSVSAADC